MRTHLNVKYLASRRQFFAIPATCFFAFESLKAEALRPGARTHDHRETAAPTPLLEDGVGFDVFTASFFKEQSNLLSLGDRFEIFQKLRFPETTVVQSPGSVSYQFKGISLTFARSYSSDIPFDERLLGITIDPEYDHRVILVLPLSGSILDLKLKSDVPNALDAERLGLILKKAKALYDKEFTQSKTKVLTSQIDESSVNIKIFELVYQASSGLQRLLMTADFTSLTLSLKVELLSEY